MVRKVKQSVVTLTKESLLSCKLHLPKHKPWGLSWKNQVHTTRIVYLWDPPGNNLHPFPTLMEGINSTLNTTFENKVPRFRRSVHLQAKYPMKGHMGLYLEPIPKGRIRLDASDLHFIQERHWSYQTCLHRPTVFCSTQRASGHHLVRRVSSGS